MAENENVNNVGDLRELLNSMPVNLSHFDKTICDILDLHGYTVALGYVYHLAKQGVAKEKFLPWLLQLLKLQQRDAERVKPQMYKNVECFMARTAHLLFEPLDEPKRLAFNDEEKYIAAPPLDHILQMSFKERLALFFKKVQIFDVFIVKVVGHKDSATYVSLLCFCNGKQLKIDDIEYKGTVKIDNTPPVGALVKAVLVYKDVLNRLFRLTTKMEDLPPEYRDTTAKLGIVTEDDLPLHYRLMKQNEQEKKPLAHFLNVNSTHSPRFCDQVLEHFFGRKLDDNPSMLSCMNSYPAIPPEMSLSNIKKEISSVKSNMKMQQGMNFYTEKNLVDSLKCFEESVKLNPENIQAMLCCGHLQTLEENHEKAVEYAEKVIALDKKNEPAKQLVLKNLKPLVENFMEKKDYVKALRFVSKTREFEGKTDELDDISLMCSGMFSTKLIKPSSLFRNHYHPCEEVKEPDKASSDMEVEDTGDSRIETTEIPPITEPVPMAEPLPVSFPQSPPSASCLATEPTQSTCETAAASPEIVEVVDVPNKEKVSSRVGSKERHHKSHSKHHHHHKHHKGKKHKKQYPSGTEHTSEPDSSSSHEIHAESLESSMTMKSLLLQKKMLTIGLNNLSGDSYDAQKSSRSSHKHSISPTLDHQRRSLSRDSLRRSSSRAHHRRSPSRDRRRRSPSTHRYRHSPSPDRYRRSPSLVRRRHSPSPVRHRRSPSPVRHRRSPSLIRRRHSPSPIRRRHSPSPVRRRHSPSPVRRRHSPSSVRRRRSPSLVRRRRSPSPDRYRRSPARYRHSPSVERSFSSDSLRRSVSSRDSPDSYCRRHDRSQSASPVPKENVPSPPLVPIIPGRADNVALEILDRFIKDEPK